MARYYRKEGHPKVERAIGHAPVGFVAWAIVALATALFVAPALAVTETETILQLDGSLLTTHGEFQHTSGAETSLPDDQPSTGSVTPVGPFTGDESEGFHTQVIVDPFPDCVEDRVFNNLADLCSTGGCAHITPGWQFSCVLLPNNTPRLYGSCDGYSIYTFDIPVQKFGGYFASNAAGPPSATARFYDAGNNLIASSDITIAPSCAWTWSGWEASGGPIISRVEILSDRPDAAFIMMDDMEIDFGDPISVESVSWGKTKAGYRAR